MKINMPDWDEFLKDVALTEEEKDMVLFIVLYRGMTLKQDLRRHKIAVIKKQFGLMVDADFSTLYNHIKSLETILYKSNLKFKEWQTHKKKSL